MLCWEAETKIDRELLREGWYEGKEKSAKLIKMGEEMRYKENKIKNLQCRSRVTKEEQRSLSSDTKGRSCVLLEARKLFPSSLSVSARRAECIYCR